MHKRRRFFFYKARAADWVRRGMRVPFILASVACSLAWADGGELPHKKPAGRKLGLSIQVQGGGWGRGRKESIETVLNGRSGPITVNGQDYKQAFQIFLDHTNQKRNARTWLERVVKGLPNRRAFIDAGADIIHVSTGQVHPEQKPVYGRMWQTPFSDRIRNELGAKTIAVGNIQDWDQVNTIVASGRADLCALARPHGVTVHGGMLYIGDSENHRIRALKL